MDSLALLCNLHADGPLTLQRLRRAGCDSIEALVQIEPVRLGMEMKMDRHAAQRFQREGQLLAERLHGVTWGARGSAPGAAAPLTEATVVEKSWPVEEEAVPFGAALEAGEVELEFTVAEERLAREDDDEVEDEEDEEDEEASEYVEYGAADEEEEEEDEDEEEDEEEALANELEIGVFGLVDPTAVETPAEPESADEREVARVLDTWRDLDRTSPPREPTVYEAPRTQPDPRVDVPFSVASLDGLTPELDRRLGELGVRTLGELIEAQARELAQRTSVGFTRIRHLQFLAGRERERRATALAAAPAPVAGGRLETAGPFA